VSSNLITRSKIKGRHLGGFLFWIVDVLVRTQSSTPRISNPMVQQARQRAVNLITL
jgi:hypothetical protein